MPGKYEKWLTRDGLTMVEAWARDGLSEKQISHNMGIAYSTFRVWKAKYPALSAATTRGKEIVDVEVENDLLKKCHGYNVQVRKTFKVKEVFYDGNGKRCQKEHLETGIDEIYVPADTQAIIWWLKNRRPDKWRDKQPSMESDDSLSRLDAILSSVNEAMKLQ